MFYDLLYLSIVPDVIETAGMRMNRYEELREMLDAGGWIDDSLGISIVSYERLKNAFDDNLEILHNILDNRKNLTEVEAKKLEEICFFRLTALLWHLQKSDDFIPDDARTVLSEVEMATIKKASLSSWLDDESIPQKDIKMSFFVNDMEMSFENLTKAKESCKMELREIRASFSKIRPPIISYLLKIYEHRLQTIDHVEKFYENELIAKIEQIKIRLNDVKRATELRANYFNEKVRHLNEIKLEIGGLKDKNSGSDIFRYLRDVSVDLKQLKVEDTDEERGMMAFFGNRILKQITAITQKEVLEEKNFEEIKDIFLHYTKLFENSLKECQAIAERIAVYVNYIEKVKLILVEVSKFSDDERRELDVSTIVEAATNSITLFISTVDSVTEAIASQFIYPQKTLKEDADVIAREFLGIVKTRGQVKEIIPLDVLEEMEAQI